MRLEFSVELLPLHLTFSVLRDRTSRNNKERIEEYKIRVSESTELEKEHSVMGEDERPAASLFTYVPFKSIKHTIEQVFRWDLLKPTSLKL